MPETVQVNVDGAIAFVSINNPPVNATSLSVREGLLAAVNDVQGCDLAVLTCEGRTFIAGGDMSEFDAPPVEPHLPDVIDAIENSATPFLAILHGTVLGGGLEVAMACAFRVAKPGTRFGLPEVNVGLVPGAGGTQRAPRLLGWSAAVDMACLGQMKSAEDLRDLGAVDLISDDPMAHVQDFVGRAYTKTSDRVVAAPMDREAYLPKVQKAARGRQGPLHNLEALSWATEPFSQAQPRERALHLDLRSSAESQALRHIFFAERAAAKPKALDQAQPLAIKRVAIVGGGLMGSGIAAACLNADLAVTIIEQTEAAATQAAKTVTGLMQGALDRGKITASDFEARCAALVTTTDYADAAEADLAIEAVFEDLNAKRTVFKDLSAVMRPDALLA
uniref:3-hydroxyacyl-CoA dehydrogenase NAD-binding domain-containing protein n=1 Tax=Cognatishimia sp. TaxID=2211648 RepID=UPI003518AB8A